MLSYPFSTHVAMVIATMGIHNLLRRSGVFDKAFLRVDKNDDFVAKIELPNTEDEMHGKMNTPEIRRSGTNCAITWQSNNDSIEFNEFFVIKMCSGMSVRHPIVYIYSQLMRLLGISMAATCLRGSGPNENA